MKDVVLTWVIVFCVLVVGVAYLFGLAAMFIAAFSAAEQNFWLGFLTVPAAIATFLASIVAIAKVAR